MPSIVIYLKIPVVFCSLPWFYVTLSDTYLYTAVLTAARTKTTSNSRPKVRKSGKVFSSESSSAA